MKRNDRNAGPGYTEELYYNVGIFSDVEREEFKEAFYKPLPGREKLFERSFLHMAVFSKEL